ncbi:hypothetical protein J2Y66_003721 [Paenarthrobacter nitroguajacolicus]|nr:hypothetical protein [Paenarthrobacter nitroguajacolicus]
MASRLQHNWRPLVGRTVTVKLQTHEVRTGVVDAVTADDQILWLDCHGNNPRRLFERSDGFQIWIDHNWEHERSSENRGSPHRISDETSVKG